MTPEYIDIPIPETFERPAMTLRAKHVSTIANPSIGQLACHNGSVGMWTGAAWRVNGQDIPDREFRSTDANAQ